MTYYFLADIFVECYLSKDHRRRLLDFIEKINLIYQTLEILK